MIYNSIFSLVSFHFLGALVYKRLSNFRKRPGEVAQCTVDDYEKAKEKNYGRNSVQDLSRFEQEILNTNILMKISGKNDKILSVLIRHEIIHAVDLLVQERSIMELDPSNNYLFAAENLTGYVDPHPLFRRYSELYGLDRPLDMRGTNLRKLKYLL